METVVCLANTDGGSIYLGVEDDGQITGLHPQHQNLSTKAAMIGNRTNPPVSVRAAPFKHAPRLFKHVPRLFKHASIHKRSGTIPLI
ncbi:MAG: ATP-binding protein [Microcoleus sp.]